MSFPLPRFERGTNNYCVEINVQLRVIQSGMEICTKKVGMANKSCHKCSAQQLVL